MYSLRVPVDSLRDGIGNRGKQTRSEKKRMSCTEPSPCPGNKPNHVGNRSDPVACSPYLAHAAFLAILRKPLFHVVAVAVALPDIEAALLKSFCEIPSRQVHGSQGAFGDSGIRQRIPHCGNLFVFAMLFQC